MHKPEPIRRHSVFYYILVTMRPMHWVKNIFVFPALFFSQHLLDSPFILQTLGAFFLFCLVASSIYLLNDIKDREKDRHHPEKSQRPIASGQLTPLPASIAAILLGLGAVAGAFVLNTNFGFVVITYALLNWGYSFYLKQVVLIDVFIVAAGFLLRALGGAFAISVEISSWFILCTMLLALFLGFIKRRQEIVLLDNAAASHRKNLEEYSPQFLDQIIAVVASGTLVSYALYTMSPSVVARTGTEHMNLTIPFIIYGLFRYLFLVYQKGEGGNPTSLVLRDKPLLLCGLIWIILVAVLLYL